MYTHHRHHKRWTNLELKPERTANIVTLRLDEILNDDNLFQAFMKRMALIIPYEKNEIETMSDDFELEILWSFEHHLEPQYIYYDGKEFIYSTHEDARIPSSIDYGHSTVIDSEGRYGVIYNKTKLLSGDPEFEMALKPEYYYINVDYEGIVEVQKEKPDMVDDHKEYLCDIVDLGTKKVLATNALCNSLDGDHFITVDDEGLLRYHQVDTKSRQISKITRPYLQIFNPIHYAPKAVQDKDTLLWGYIDKHCDEIIAPKFTDWNTFSDNYTVVSLDDRDVAIDIEGNVLIEPKYDKIKHYENDLFFVQKEDKWAVFKSSEVLIDFLDPVEWMDGAFIKTHLPRYIPAEEVPTAVQEHMNFKKDEKVEYVLKCLMLDRKRELKKQRYVLPLVEYVLLFETFEGQRELDEAGLWWREVDVKACEIISRYKDVLVDHASGIVGWRYPASAGMYNMSEEIPVMFEKKDGDSISLGIPLDRVELKR